MAYLGFFRITYIKFGTYAQHGSLIDSPAIEPPYMGLHIFRVQTTISDTLRLYAGVVRNVQYTQLFYLYRFEIFTYVGYL